MAAPQPAAVFHELTSRGLVAALPPPQLLSGGNADRAAHTGRSSWLVSLADGKRARLILGHELGALAARHAAGAQACPPLVSAPLFHVRTASGEALAEEFLDVPTLEVALQQRRISPEMARQAFSAASAALAGTEQPSTEAAWAEEWSDWSARLVCLAALGPADRRLLREVLLPALAPRLSRTPPTTRWTNGDFTSGNILVDESGRLRLIDLEFASRTHFFTEDAVRFHVLSPAARQWPDLFSSLPSSPDPAWHLYFWLRQLQLEAEHNTSAYLARVLPVRLAVIRRLAEATLALSLDGWSASGTPVEYRIENARWRQEGSQILAVSGWVHLPAAAAIRAVVASTGTVWLGESAPSERPDVQEYFAGEPRARSTGFDLRITAPDPDASLLLSAVSDDGTLLPFHWLQPGDLPGRGPAIGDYAAWAARNDPDPPHPADPPPSGPLFSILLPVYRTPLPLLRDCVASVQGQHYPRWELVIVDDASGSTALTDLLHEFAALDRRISVQSRAENGGIARATNDALATARGDFIVLLDHDDLLRPHALAELADAIEQDPSVDVIYSDEDKVTADGAPVTPFCKPDYSPEFLLGVMYVGHVLSVRTPVARSTGGFDPAYDGVQDYEFFLRVTERTHRVRHVARILYHWRQSALSSALHGNIKGNMDEKQAAAVRAHLQRRGDTRLVHPVGGHRLQLKATRFPTVDIVRSAAAEDPLAALRQAARTSRAEILILLQIDPPAGDGEWSRELAALAARPDSGCVAPVLLSAEGKVLESGCTLGSGSAIPVMRGFDPGGDGYNGSLLCNREVAAVSPLCTALRRELLVPEETAPTWLDFCAVLRARGLFNRVCAVTHVATTLSWRTERKQPAGRADHDGFFNPHFSCTRADYSLAGALPGALAWHLDTPMEGILPFGQLELRGWCFRPDGQEPAMRLTVAGLTWPVCCILPRPDVVAAYPGLAHDRCGFAVRLRVPAGRHKLILEAVATGGLSRLLLRRQVTVPATAALRRWLAAAPPDRLAFQFLAGPFHAPRPLMPESFPRPADLARARPRLAIVTPSYQQAPFLGETMRQVLEEPGIDCDYVVQDGGSTDGSVQIIEQHASRLKAWASAPDAGQADAIARGFRRTDGRPEDVMAWINSDDFYLPGALAFVADYFATHPETDVIYGHRILVDETSREIGRWFLPPHDDAVLQLNDFVPQETMFWRRRIWDKVGGLDTSFQFAMDWDLLLRFQAAGAKIVRVPRFLACFRVHAAQKTSAAMHLVGQREIDRLRTRTHGRVIPPPELEQHARLKRYLRRSAFIEFLWTLGIRAP